MRLCGQGKTLARGAGAKQELAHRSGHTETNGRNVARDELHGVVDGQAVGDRATRAVDIEADVCLGSSAARTSSWAQSGWPTRS